MNKLFSQSNRILLFIIGTIVLLSLSGFVLIPFEREGRVLFLLIVLIGIIGVVGSHLIALGITLFLFFLLGSTLFWFSFIGNIEISNNIPPIYIIMWMVMLLVISLFTGRLSMLVKDVNYKNEALREQFRTLVAIDPITGFDNEDRFLLELQLEYSRSKRYGHTFTLLLFKINHLDQFRQLYGEGEYDNLLIYISKSIFNSTRSSDQRFRIEEDIFALLLPDTPVENIHVVIEKITDKLTVYELANKKYVSLVFQFGYVGFETEFIDHIELFELAKEQVLTNVS